VARALRLIAYNEFIKGSVRINHKNCEVTVETDKGVVKVIRGKDNIWEVTPNGEPTQHYEKIGKNPLPQAMEVLGLSKVTLGSVEMPVNIMDQVEGHFMLSDLGGEKATGSIKAQIIDEISGLSGIEEVIRDVSLDCHRFGREIKTIEERIAETEEQMHDQNALDFESSILDKAQALINESSECLKVAEEIETVKANYDREYDSLRTSKDSILKLPDPDKALKLLSKAEEGVNRSQSMGRFLKGYSGLVERIEGQREELTVLPDVDGLNETIDKAKECLEKANNLRKMFVSFSRQKEEIERSREVVKEKEAEIRQNKKDEDEMMKEVKVCPLTLNPVSGGCLKVVVSS